MVSTNSAFPFGLLEGTIPRETLIKRIKAISAKKNVFLTAPGGYGKSVAAAQWLSAVRGKAVRMAVGTLDDDPGIFYMRLAESIAKLTGNELMMQSIPHARISFDRLLEIIRLLPEKCPRCYFVIDDLHMIRNDEINNTLPIIATKLPHYICRLLTSRSEPPGDIIKSGMFEVLTKDDFLFSTEEVEWLSAEKERVLTGRQVRDLLEMTGGWAMYLDALLSGGETSKGDPGQTLMQYLDDRVWNVWDDETKALLLRLAVPAEITAPLAGRLTGQGDGQAVLERLIKKENAFLARVDENTYRFHDVFHGFLLERSVEFFGVDEIRRLNGIAAAWHYQQGDYYEGARHYINNSDHDGISRCMEATDRYHEQTGGISVEARLDFFNRHVMGLSPEFISMNPSLIAKCAVVAYHDGNSEGFLRYVDSLNRELPEISSEHSGIIENAMFINSLDFRMTLKECAERARHALSLGKHSGTDAKTVTITQNLPLIHRSMRDFSEYHQLNAADLDILRAGFGAMVGKDYPAMEQAIIAGIYYERAELLKAVHHATNAYRACGGDMHPETIFCAHMVLSAVLYAMDARREADAVMEEAGGYIERKAHFLRQNFKALQTGRLVRNGVDAAAREWLAVYAWRSGRLPFYQMCRHFTTLRSYIAVRDHAAAIGFGMKLLRLASEYNRPLDQIESGLLTAIALWRSGEKSKAAEQLGRAVSIAAPYGFTQLFLNEGGQLLPIFWELAEGADNPPFAERLTLDIYKRHDLIPEGKGERKPTARQLSMLEYLRKGMTYNEIAEATGLGRGTVKSHVLLLYRRLGVHDAQGAVLKAKMLGL